MSASLNLFDLTSLSYIESADDTRLRPYRELTGATTLLRSGLFVAEGRFVVERLIALRRYRLHSLLVTSPAWTALSRALGHHAVDLPPDVPVYVVSQLVMNDVVGFNIHRGCLALAYRPAAHARDELTLSSLRRALVLEGVNNPDNVGGLFRSAAAFGVDAVVLGPACGDPLYRKAIRTSMAATLSVPFIEAEAWPDALVQLRQSGLRVLALSLGADATSLAHVQVSASDRIAILVGSEGQGLTQSALAACEERVRIDMSSAVDSLNVTVAASIAMYAVFRAPQCGQVRP